MCIKSLFWITSVVGTDTLVHGETEKNCLLMHGQKAREEEEVARVPQSTDILSMA